MNEQTSYTIDALSESVGIPIRTIRFYVSEGLLPGPGSRGKAATYSEEHLLRLRLIRRLVEERVPLAEIRERLASLTTAEMRGLLAAEDRRSATLERAAEQSPEEYIAALLDQARAKRQPPTAPQSARTPPRSPVFGTRLVGQHGRSGYSIPDVWRRIQLAPGVELHVRGDAELRESELIERVVEAAHAPGSAPPKEAGWEDGRALQES